MLPFNNKVAERRKERKEKPKKQGCFFKNTERSLSLPAHDIHAVDATGAGDNFIAGFASERLRGHSVEEALLFGNACGAICTTAIGAGTALKTRAQVEQFLLKANIAGGK